ncbi:MAG: site-2 protease family protein [Coriobacteriales bacterium]|nr:site-2 protease family protein [Coriobacteriales bacterium]
MTGINVDRIINIVLTVFIVLVATVLHEMSHAAMANALGDPTAKERGRLTLNPFAHLDLVGSVILPALMAFAGGPIFAFAKPVPYNPRRLKHPIRDEVLVALAGPACNLVQALVGTAIFRGMMAWASSSVTATAANGDVIYIVMQTIATYVYLNLMLMFFNLIPLPPLDGSAIISPLLRGEARMWYYRVQQYAMPVLLAVMFLVPMMFHVDPVGWYLNHTALPVASLLLGI